MFFLVSQIELRSPRQISPSAFFRSPKHHLRRPRGRRTRLLPSADGGDAEKGGTEVGTATLLLERIQLQLGEFDSGRFRGGKLFESWDCWPKTNQLVFFLCFFVTVFCMCFFFLMNIGRLKGWKVYSNKCMIHLFIIIYHLLIHLSLFIPYYGLC